MVFQWKLHKCCPIAYGNIFYAYYDLNWPVFNLYHIHQFIKRILLKCRIFQVHWKWLEYFCCCCCCCYSFAFSLCQFYELWHRNRCSWCVVLKISRLLFSLAIIHINTISFFFNLIMSKHVDHKYSHETSKYVWNCRCNLILICLTD